MDCQYIKLPCQTLSWLNGLALEMLAVELGGAAVLTWSGPGSIVVGLTCVCKHGFLRCLILCLLRLLAARAVYFCMFGMSASGPKVGGFGF